MQQLISVSLLKVGLHALLEEVMQVPLMTDLCNIPVIFPNVRTVLLYKIVTFSVPCNSLGDHLNSKNIII